MSYTKQTYKNCLLVPKQESDGFRVDIQPTAESKAKPMTTMVFQREEDAVADAKKYVDAHGR
jgi:hypothetical protein